jgi:hypothetical protein
MISTRNRIRRCLLSQTRRRSFVLSRLVLPCKLSRSFEFFVKFFRRRFSSIDDIVSIIKPTTTTTTHASQAEQKHKGDKTTTTTPQRHKIFMKETDVSFFFVWNRSTIFHQQEHTHTNRNRGTTTPVYLFVIPIM